MPQPRHLLTLAAALLTLPAAAQNPIQTPIQTSIQASAPADPTHGLALADIDPAIRPGDDFFHFANGAYITRTPLPPDRSSIGVFNTLSDRSIEHVTAIIHTAVKTTAEAGAQPEPEQKRIADLYHSYMDQPAIERHGLDALRPHLAEIAAISSPHDLAVAFGHSIRADVDALNNTNFHTHNLFGLWVAPGFNDPDHYAPYLLQGGLELPNRDYYLDTSASMQAIRTEYTRHITATLTLAGIPDAPARAARILALETAIAQVHVSLAASEDIHAANNPWTLADFTAKAPGLDWPTVFTAAGLSTDATYIVWQPSAFTGEAALVQSQPLDAWKDLLAYHLIESDAEAVSAKLADEQFAFFGKTLSGTPAQRPRDVRASLLVSATLADDVGKLYAAHYFTEGDKAQVQALVANLLTAFRHRLENATWMAPATREEALRKLATLKVGVGFPDHWRSYGKLEIRLDDLFGNLFRADLFELQYSIGRIGLLVDRKEWCMSPQTVNAVNLPLDNGLNFPAAILQPPFFDPKAPPAANYGAIGTIIGHEISHTFDSEGAAFDSQGRVRNWWTPGDLAHFNAATSALAAQFDTYHPFPGVSVNGKQTLGEDIADLAGLTAALDGFHEAMKDQVPANVGPYTPDQQFFISFGQNWASVIRDAALRRQVLTDPHAPAEYRAATVRNLDPWYKAFNIQPTDKLYLAREARVHIW